MLLTPVDIPFAAGGSHDLSLNRNMIKLVKGNRLHLAELQKYKLARKASLQSQTFLEVDLYGWFQ